MVAAWELLGRKDQSFWWIEKCKESFKSWRTDWPAFQSLSHLTHDSILINSKNNTDIGPRIWLTTTWRNLILSNIWINIPLLMIHYEYQNIGTIIIISFSRILVIYKPIKEIYTHYLTLAMTSRYRIVPSFSYEYPNLGCYSELSRYSPTL